MRLFVFALVLTVLLAAAIGAITAITYADALSSKCLLLQGQGDFQLMIHANSGFLLRRRQSVLSQRWKIREQQASPDHRFTLVLATYGSNEELSLVHRDTGRREILTTGSLISYRWLEDADRFYLIYQHQPTSLIEVMPPTSFTFGVVTLTAQGISQHDVFESTLNDPLSWLPNNRGLYYFEGDQLRVWALQDRRWATIQLPAVRNHDGGIYLFESAFADQFILAYGAGTDAEMRLLIVILSLTELTSRHVLLDGGISPYSGVAVLWPPDPPTDPATAIFAVNYQARDGAYYSALVNYQQARVLHTLPQDADIRISAPFWSAHGDILYSFAAELSDQQHMLLQQFDLRHGNGTTSVPIIRNIPFALGPDGRPFAVIWPPQYDTFLAVSERNGRYDLMLLNLSDGSVTALLSGMQHISEPAWSRNGEYAIAVWADGQYSGILALDARTGQITNTPLAVVLDNSYFDYSVEALWFSTEMPERVVLTFRVPNLTMNALPQALFLLVDLRASRVIPLSGPSDRRDFNLFWYGLSSTFWVESALPNNQVIRIGYDVNGQMLGTFVGPQPGYWETSALSPDGQKMLVRYPQSTYLLDALTNTAQPLNIPPPFVLSWSADGTRFVTSDQQTAAIFDSAGRLLHRVRIPTMLPDVAWSACQ